MTGGEGCHEDIGLSAFDRIVMHTASKMSVHNRRVLASKAASYSKLNKWDGSLTVTVVGLLICSPNLPQKLHE